MTMIDENQTSANPLIQPQPAPADLKAAVAEAIRNEFAVTSWKPTEKIRFVVNCPSGQKVLCKHLSTMDLLEADLIEEIDFFTKRLFPANLDAQGNLVETTDEEDLTNVWALLKDVNKRARFFALLNKIMAVGVVRPIVIDDGVEVQAPKGKPPTVKLGVKKIQPKEGEALASSIDFADRMTIFAELNKPLNEIQPFRREQIVSLAGLEPSQKPEGKAE